MAVGGVMKTFDNVVFGLHRLFMCVPDVAGKNHKTGGKCKMKGNEKTSVKALRVVERIYEIH